MKKTAQTSWASRALRLGLGLALIAGASLVAAPAQASPVTYSVTGLVGTQDDQGGTVYSAGLQVGVVGGPQNTVTDVDGHFTLSGLVNGTYNLEISAPVPAGAYVTQNATVTIQDADATLADVVLLPTPTATPTPTPTPTPPPADPALPQLPQGTVTVTGSPTVGSVLTATTAGWPAGTTFGYQWFFNCGECGGPIDGETSASYTVTDAYLGQRVGVVVTGSKDGFESSSQMSDLTATVTAAAQPTPAPAAENTAAPAPVASSDALPAYLAAHDSTPQSQTEVGLPSGPLDPNASYTANVSWSATDSFVDVYLYSTPTLVGTFPVVNGAARITLSAHTLGTLAAGSHTLVVVGQSSGTVKSVALRVAPSLASTGLDTTAPLGAATLLLLLGAALLFVRRRRLAA